MTTAEKIEHGKILLPKINACVAAFPNPISAQVLLLATAAVESEFVERRQAGFKSCPQTPEQWAGAWGLMQQEMPSIEDGLNMCRQSPRIMKMALAGLDAERGRIWMNAPAQQVARALTFDCGDPLSILGARLHYYRAPGALPAISDMDGMWMYYKKWYNSALGETTRSRFFECWNTFCIPVLNDEGRNS